MADIAASDITYTVQKTAKMEDGRRRSNVKIAFGDGALTYPSGGIPLSSLSGAGFPNVVAEVILMDANDASGISWKYDYENNKLRGYIAPAQTHAHDLKIIGGQAATTTNEVGHYATDILGKEAATDATIAKANSATKGGVMSESLAAAAMTEISGAVAAQVLYAVVVGY
jgi:hypothetical protein